MKSEYSEEEFRNAIRQLLNDAARSGLPVPEIIRITEEELKPKMDDIDRIGLLLRRYTTTM